MDGQTSDLRTADSVSLPAQSTVGCGIQEIDVSANGPDLSDSSSMTGVGEVSLGMGGSPRCSAGVDSVNAIVGN